MKKIVSVLMVLALVMSLGAVSYADGDLGVTGITVTRNPVSMTCRAGETAWFSASASTFETVDWTFVAPSGAAVSVQEFRNFFPEVIVGGEYTTNLTVSNLSAALNGWAVFCSFHNSIDNASTQWAFFGVYDSTLS